MRFEIVVMDEDSEGFGDQLWGILHEPGMPVLQLTVSLDREGALDGRFGRQTDAR